MMPDLFTPNPDLVTPATQFYAYREFRCAYDLHQSAATDGQTKPPLVLIHPIGVGLSRRFWDPFCRLWLQRGAGNAIYNPDLLGCGASDMPHMPYYPEDWADQLLHLIQDVIQRPVILVVQGALLPVALVLAEKAGSNIHGLVLSDPPAWTLMTRSTSAWRAQLSWQLFTSPLGQGFYRYARRRQFLQSFSAKQLFADSANIDQNWLDALRKGSENPASRHAVFSFLTGFWRRNWEAKISHLTPPTLIVMGQSASSISRSAQGETPQNRIDAYLKQLPNGQAVQIPGRNVLPYESAPEFVEAITPFIQRLG